MADDAPDPQPKKASSRRDLPEDVVQPIGVGLVAILGAVAVVAAPLVPSILWYTGNTLFDTSSRDLTFAEAAWMLLDHDSEWRHGVVLFLLPSIAAAAALLLRSQIGAKALWRALSLASVVIAVLELFLVFIEADYGSVYDAVAGFSGIQSMIPNDRFTTHALMLLGGSVVWATGEELRLRKA